MILGGDSTLKTPILGLSEQRTVTRTLSLSCSIAIDLVWLVTPGSVISASISDREKCNIKI